jgi:hypothetical protein
VVHSSCLPPLDRSAPTSRRICAELLPYVDDAFDDGLDYLELRFSPGFIASETGLARETVIDSVADGARLSRAIEQRLDRDAYSLAECPRASLCHNDLYEGNLLIDDSSGRWELTGLVDVEKAIAAYPLLDVGKTDCYSIRGNHSKAAGLVEGYGLELDAVRIRFDLYRIYHTLELWDWFHQIGQPVELEDQLPGHEPAADLQVKAFEPFTTGAETAAAMHRVGRIAVIPSLGQPPPCPEGRYPNGQGGARAEHLFLCPGSAGSPRWVCGDLVVRGSMVASAVAQSILRNQAAVALDCGATTA